MSARNQKREDPPPRTDAVTSSALSSLLLVLEGLPTIAIDFRTMRGAARLPSGAYRLFYVQPGLFSGYVIAAEKRGEVRNLDAVAVWLGEPSRQFKEGLAA